ncbi:DUF1294 domain-containing protein [Aureimonas sp. ME7]|uniref:DUF1294 domain-containing protein n=1 Tax=Aureimonas sp. ME7 TaxID=2744252 RepID=UPI001FCE5BCF|nr:DUF1294 domain-containing protein [Aureimonas sp. ME7]
MVAYLVVVNVAGYGAMVLDKGKARCGDRRIPESKLLGLALIGGSVGTILAQQLMRHKTRKEPFRTILIAIVALQIALLLALATARPERFAGWLSWR